MSVTTFTTLSLTKKTLDDDSRRWLNIVRYHESGTIIQLQNDCVYRIPQLLADKRSLRDVLGPYYRKYLLGYIAVNDRRLIDSIKQTILGLCKERKIPTKEFDEKSLSSLLKIIEKKGYDIGLFIYHTTNLFRKENWTELFQLEVDIRQNKNCSIVMFSETDIAHSSYNTLVNQCSSLFTHIIKYPLYGYEDSKQFITYNETLWKVKFPHQVKEKVIENCGGYLWLMRQALRLLRDEPKLPLEHIFSHELMLKKLEVIWAKLTPSEQDILYKIHTGTLTEKEMNSHEFQYLIQIRMIRYADTNPVLGIPLLKYIIEKVKKVNELKWENGIILFNGKDISFEFTTNELRFLTILLQKKGQIVNRETIAERLWGENWEDKYSDWALDRIVFRLRKRLQQLGINQKLIKTYKAQGIMFG